MGMMTIAMLFNDVNANGDDGNGNHRDVASDVE
jgi:hypothetical protein